MNKDNCNMDDDSKPRLTTKNIKLTVDSRKLAVRKTGSRTYVELITEAIMRSPHQRLTANEIYECLMHNVHLDHSPSSLKNTIRHTLSWYKRFKRVQRGTLQKPAWWTVDSTVESSSSSSKLDGDTSQFFPSTSNRSPSIWSDSSSYSNGDLCRLGGPNGIGSSQSYYDNQTPNQPLSTNFYGQTATVVTDRGTVCGVDVPNPLNVTLHLQDVKSTQTWSSTPSAQTATNYTRYRNRCANVGRRNNGFELRLAPLPADLASIDLNSGAECDITRVFQQEMDLEGRVDLECFRNCAQYQ